MVIECSACQTRFRLADDKIKPQGTKVRCSKCGEIFTVLPPEPEAAAIAPPAPVPTPAAPVPAPVTTAATKGEFDDWSDFEASGSGPEATADEDFDLGPGAADAAAESEHDEFIFVDDGEEEAADDEFALDGESGAGDDDFALDDDSAADAEFAFAESANADRDELDFDAGTEGAGEDFAFDEEVAGGGEHLPPLEFDSLSFEDIPATDDGAGDDLAQGLGSGVRDELAFEESAATTDSDFAPASEPDTFSWGESDVAAAAPDRFGFGSADPDEFDFGSAGGAEDADAATDGLDFSLADLAPDEPAPREASPPPPPAAKAAPSATERPQLHDPPPPATRATATRTKHSRRKKKGGSGILTWLLVLILLGLCGAAGYFYWIGQFPDLESLINRFLPQDAAAPAVSQIRISEPSGIFINNSEAGQLFVIQGKAVNGYAESRSAMAVKGRIYNRSGALLKEQLVFCGNTLSESELKTLPLAKLRERTENQFGDSLSNLNVAPGKGIPFTIVFSDLPADLSEFNVEPGDSIAGSKP